MACGRVERIRRAWGIGTGQLPAGKQLHQQALGQCVACGKVGHNAHALVLLGQGQALPRRRLHWLGLALVGVALSSGLDGGQAGTTSWPGVVLALLVLGLVHTACMYTLMYAAFQRLPAQAIAGLSFIYPAMALLVDLLWFGARPTPAQWLGMAVILGAVWGWRRGAESNQPKQAVTQSR